jgi:ligand-binding sensor domain-containing protein
MTGVTAALAPLFLWLFFQTQLQLSDWFTFTSHRTVRTVAVIANHTWVGTTGGLYVFSGLDPDYRIFTNIDGLSGNTVAAITEDAAGGIWLGMEEGALHYLESLDDSPTTIIIETSGFRITDLAINGDDIYIASNLGISRYSIARAEVRETYRNLGIFERDTPVTALYLQEGELWAGTDRGIARAALSSPNLQDPQFWTNYTTAQGLPSDITNDFAWQDGRLYAATKNGIAYLNENHWSQISTGLTSVQMTALTVWNDRLVAATADDVFTLESADIWQPMNPRIWNTDILTAGPDGALWAGSDRNGLWLARRDGSRQLYLPNGPAGNSFNSMSIDQQGNLWSATGNDGNRGIYRFDGETWRNYTTTDGLPSMNVTTAFVDSRNGKWFGLPGDGMTLISADESTVTVIDETNGILSPAVTEHFTVVEDFAEDSRGNVWLANKFADTGQALVAVDPNFQFHYFSISEGLGSGVISALAVDTQDRIWIGSSDQSGIRVFDWGGTLAERSDDQWIRVTTTDGLVDNNINTITVDRNGTVWIGTPDGANYFDGSALRMVFGLPDNHVNIIQTDAFNNKWFGTRGGIGILDRDNIRMTSVTSSNSQLVDNNILSLALQQSTGHVFFGTGAGLSRARTPFLLDDATHTEIIAFPNPYILSAGASPAILGDFDLDTEVKIFTSSGVFVRGLSASDGTVLGSKAVWNGRNKDGRLVASGVYIIVSSTFRGAVKRGKLAVVRQ